MNTIRSTWLGWGTLCVAGGGAYYFAKRSINADRASRHQAEMEKKARFSRIEEKTRFSSAAPTSPTPKTKKSDNKGLDHVGSPSSEISEDVEPVGHAPENAEQRMREKSKYEAAEPYVSQKGNRFS